jgi:hypothetical protein
MLGPQHNLAQKKKGKNREAKKEQEKKLMSRHRVDENDDDPQSLRHSENSTTLLARRAPHTKQHLQEGENILRSLITTMTYHYKFTVDFALISKIPSSTHFYQVDI